MLDSSTVNGSIVNDRQVRNWNGQSAWTDSYMAGSVNTGHSGANLDGLHLV
jgi:hypothetical protein